MLSSSASSSKSRPQKRGDDLDGEVVGRRPETAGGDDEVHARVGHEAQRASISRGRSPQIVMCASSTPSSRSRSAIHGPFRSWTRPVRTSVPVTTMPARALTGYETTHSGADAPWRPRNHLCHSALSASGLPQLNITSLS